MMKLLLPAIVFLVMSFIQPLQAGDPLVVDRIEQLRKVRMIEALDLSEEQSVRFFARLHDLNKSKEKIRQQKTAMLDKLERMVRNDVKEYRDIFPQIATHESEALEVEREFFNGLSEFLSDEQRAKFLLFERQFQRELQDALTSIQRKRSSPANGE